MLWIYRKEWLLMTHSNTASYITCTKQDISKWHRGPGWLNYYLITHTSLSSIWRGFAPSFVNHKKGCTRLAAASDKVYQLLAHGWCFSPASSTTKTGRHDIAEILLKVALKTPKIQSINRWCNVSRGRLECVRLWVGA